VRLKPGFRIGASFRARFDAHGERLVTLGKRITLWNVAARTRIGIGPPLRSPVHVDFSPDGAQVAAKGNEGEILVFDARSLAEVARFPGAGTPPLRFSPCGRYLLDGLTIRDAASGQPVWQEGGDTVFDLACTGDRRLWAYTQVSRQRTRFFTRTWPFWDADPRPLPLEHGVAIALTDDGRRLAVAAGDVQVWDLDVEPTVLARRAVDGGTPDALSWSPDGTALAHCENRAAYVYDAELSELVSMPHLYGCDADFSPRGDLVAFGSWSKGIVIPRP
jgi:WD40 repeat protein